MPMHQITLDAPLAPSHEISIFLAYTRHNQDLWEFHHFVRYSYSLVDDDRELQFCVFTLQRFVLVTYYFADVYRTRVIQQMHLFILIKNFFSQYLYTFCNLYQQIKYMYVLLKSCFIQYYILGASRSAQSACGNWVKETSLVKYIYKIKKKFLEN